MARVAASVIVHKLLVDANKMAETVETRCVTGANVHGADMQESQMPSVPQEPHPRSTTCSGRRRRFVLRSAASNTSLSDVEAVDIEGVEA